MNNQERMLSSLVQQEKERKNFNFKAIAAFLCAIVLLLLISDVGLVFYILSGKSADPDINKSYDTFISIQSTIAESDLSSADFTAVADAFNAQGILTDYEEQENYILIETESGINYLFTDDDAETSDAENLSVTITDPATSTSSTSAQDEALSFFEKHNHGKFILWGGHVAFTYRYGPVFRTNLRVNDNELWKKYAKELKNKEIIVGKDFFWLCPSYFKNHLSDNALLNCVVILHDGKCTRDNRLLRILFEKGAGMILLAKQDISKDLQNELLSLFMKNLAERNEDGKFTPATECLTLTKEQFSKNHAEFADKGSQLTAYYPESKNDFTLPDPSAVTTTATPVTEATQPPANNISIPLSQESAVTIVKQAKKTITKWVSGVDSNYNINNNRPIITVNDKSYSEMSYTKAEMKADICQYLHESFFEDIFENYYIEQDGKLYYGGAGFGIEEIATIVRSDLAQTEDSYTLTMHTVKFNTVTATQDAETVHDQKITFVQKNGNWIIDNSNENDYWFAYRIAFLEEDATTRPATLQNPKQAHLDSYGDEDGMSVNLRTGPATDFAITKKIPDGAKIYVCGTDEAHPDWIYICYLGEFGWVINSCVFY